MRMYHQKSYKPNFSVPCVANSCPRKAKYSSGATYVHLHLFVRKFIYQHTFVPASAFMVKIDQSLLAQALLSCPLHVYDQYQDTLLLIDILSVLHNVW